MVHEEKKNLLALSLVQGIGSILVRQLLSYFGTAEAVFSAPRGRLLKVAGIGEVLSQEILKKNTFDKADRILAECAAKQASLSFFNEERYPTLLKEIPDAPVYLYWQGNQNPTFARSIAIVGTRQCTEYGKKVTEDIVNALTAYSPIIVSGLAYGIDIAAHKAAFRNGLPTIAVLGGGFDMLYPASHQRYVPEILQHGALVSEYHFDAKPDATHFPARNRIVAGMCEATIVVEAAESGGALITAELANDYNREVFAVPGNLGSKYSEGCNKLIAQNKAAIYNGISDLAQRLRWDEPRDTPAFSNKTPNDLSDKERKIFELLRDNGETHVDPLAWKSQLHINELASILLSLEIKGLISTLPGKKYRLSSIWPSKTLGKQAETK